MPPASPPNAPAVRSNPQSFFLVFQVLGLGQCPAQITRAECHGIGDICRDSRKTNCHQDRESDQGPTARKGIDKTGSDRGQPSKIDADMVHLLIIISFSFRRYSGTNASAMPGKRNAIMTRNFQLDGMMTAPARVADETGDLISHVSDRHQPWDACCAGLSFSDGLKLRR